MPACFRLSCAAWATSPSLSVADHPESYLLSPHIPRSGHVHFRFNSKLTVYRIASSLEQLERIAREGRGAFAAVESRICRACAAIRRAKNGRAARPSPTQTTRSLAGQRSRTQTRTGAADTGTAIVRDRREVARAGRRSSTRASKGQLVARRVALWGSSIAIRIGRQAAATKGGQATEAKAVPYASSLALCHTSLAVPWQIRRIFLYR